jgi:thioredoxin-like negative regulator of GroEL
MIEQLIEAERLLGHGLIDRADRLYRQIAAADPRNAIAVVGLARVALERGDDRTAYVEARRALEIDPEDQAAQHLVMRLAEVMTARGETPPAVATDAPVASPPTTAAVAEPAEGTPPVSTPTPARPAPATKPRRRKRRGIVARLLGRGR